MATYLDIQEDVAAILIDLPAVTLAAVPKLVNFALRELQTRHNFKVMEKTLAENTVALTRNLVAKPADFKGFRNKPFYTEFSGNVVPLEVAPSKEMLLVNYETDSDGPPAYLFLGEATDDAGASSIEVWPLSDGQSDYSAVPTGEYRVSIPYWRFLSALSGDGATNWFTTHEVGEFYLVYRAVAEGFARNWDVEKQTEWLAKAQAMYELIVNEDKALMMSGSDTFAIHKGARRQSIHTLR